MSESQNQLELISRLLQLERAFRHAESVEELGYILVNDCRSLLSYRQAVLWRTDSEKVFCASGLAVVDANAPYLIWLKRIFKHLSVEASQAIKPLTAVNFEPVDAGEWSQWLPQHALWVPLQIFSDQAHVGLLLAREQPWNDSEQHLLEHLSDSFAFAWSARAPRKPFWQQFHLSKKRLLISLTVLFCILLFPVRQTALAPASVIAAKPTILRASIDGVVDQFFVQPNDPVIEGQTLVKLDDHAIKNELSITRKELAVAEAEYRKSAQQAMFDRDSKSQLAILKSRIDQQRAEVKSMEDWLTRIEIKAPHKGVAVFTDVNDWLGRPVKIGERILMIADPNEVELEIQLPIADAINLQTGAKVLLFLNIAPISPVSAELYYAAYQAQVAEDDSLAYRLKAHFKLDGELPRIGLKGTAKVYGERVPLMYYLFRRPLAFLRQWLGM